MKMGGQPSCRGEWRMKSYGLLTVLALALAPVAAQQNPQGTPPPVHDMGDRGYSADDIERALAPPAPPAAPVSKGLTRNLIIVPSNGGGGRPPDTTPPPPRKISIRLQFEFDSAVLTPDARVGLDKLAAALNRPSLESGRFLISGHTDSTGRYERNLVLSKQRADSVRSYLIQHGGVDGTRLVAVGRASDEPIDADDPRSSVNRRVQIEALD
jgi:outer membrane protein OmpA-like peptidoglycan-associated protein